MANKVLIHDTSVLLNLLASTRIKDVIEATGRKAQICPQVANELISLRDFESGERYQVSIDCLFKENILELTNIISDTEKDLFVLYAQKLDDGEAATAALAEARGIEIATDDKKAIHILQNRCKSIRIWTTPELIFNWVEKVNPIKTMVEEVIVRIEYCARYRPSRNHPLNKWWHSFSIKD